MVRTDEGVAGAVTTRPLRLSRFLQLEAMGDRDVTLFLSHDGARVRIPAALYALLLRFEVPQGIDTVVAGHPQAQKVAQALLNLMHKGFLHEAGQEQASGPLRLVTDPPQRMFDAPAFKAGATRAGIVVLGVPSDSADPDCAGGRAAPMALREVSLHLLHTMDLRSGQARGWFDADERRSLLQGVALADAGDVFVDPGEERHAVFERMAQVLAGIGDAVPVVIGGDSTACWPVLARRSTPESLCLVRFGGPAQRTPSAGGVVSSATLLGRAIALEGVAGTLQIAPSGQSGGWSHPAHRQVTAAALRAAGADQVLQHLVAGQRVHLGLDLSVLGKPGAPLSDDRLRYHEVVDLIARIGAHCRIVGIDLTGMIPACAGWNVVAATALHLLVLAMDAARHQATPGGRNAA